MGTEQYKREQERAFNRMFTAKGFGKKGTEYARRQAAEEYENATMNYYYSAASAADNARKESEERATDPFKELGYYMDTSKYGTILTKHTVNKDEWCRAVAEMAMTTGILCQDVISGWNPKWGEIHEEFDRYCTARWGPVDSKTCEWKSRGGFLKNNVYATYNVCYDPKDKKFVSTHGEKLFRGQDEERYLTYSSVFDRLPNIQYGIYGVVNNAPQSDAAKESFSGAIIWVIVLWGTLILMCNGGSKAVDILPFPLNCFAIVFIVLGAIFSGHFIFKIVGKIGDKAEPKKSKIIKSITPIYSEPYKGKYIEGTRVLRATVPRGSTFDGEKVVIDKETPDKMLSKTEKLATLVEKTEAHAKEVFKISNLTYIYYYELQRYDNSPSVYVFYHSLKDALGDALNSIYPNPDFKNSTNLVQYVYLKNDDGSLGDLLMKDFISVSDFKDLCDLLPREAERIYAYPPDDSPASRLKERWVYYIEDTRLKGRAYFRNCSENADAIWKDWDKLLNTTDENDYALRRIKFIDEEHMKNGYFYDNHIIEFNMNCTRIRKK